MATVNINDRASVEAIYTVNTFEHDAARNARGEAAVLHGLKILSEADADGNIDLLPAAQHVAERDPEGDSIFLVPQLSTAGATYLDGAYGGSAAPTDDGIIAKADDYRRFIDEVIAIARTADFKAPAGRGDERLKGFRGG